MTARPPRSRLCSAASLLLAVALVAGCGGSSDEPGDGPSAGGTPSSSASAASTSSASASPTSEAAPATGPLLEVEAASMHAPDGWQRMKAVVSFQRSARDPQGGGTAQIGYLPAAPGPSLDELARNAIEHGSYGKRRPRPAGTVTVNGVECYKVAGRTDPGTYYELYGAITGGNEVSISFTFFTRFISPAERQQVVESTLASVEWR